MVSHSRCQAELTYLACWLNRSATPATLPPSKSLFSIVPKDLQVFCRQLFDLVIRQDNTEKSAEPAYLLLTGEADLSVQVSDPVQSIHCSASRYFRLATFVTAFRSVQPGQAARDTSKLALYPHMRAFWVEQTSLRTLIRSMVSVRD